MMISLMVEGENVEIDLGLVKRGPSPKEANYP